MGRPRKLTPAQEARLVKMISKGGASYPEIAARFGVGEWKARQLAREHGVKKPPSPRARVIRIVNGKPVVVHTGGAQPDMKSRKQVQRLREKGWTLQRIGDHLGVSRQRAHQLLQKVLETLPKGSALHAADLRARRVARGKDPETGKPLKRKVPSGRGPGRPKKARQSK